MMRVVVVVGIRQECPGAGVVIRQGKTDLDVEVEAVCGEVVVVRYGRAARGWIVSLVVAWLPKDRRGKLPMLVVPQNTAVSGLPCRRLRVCLGRARNECVGRQDQLCVTGNTVNHADGVVLRCYDIPDRERRRETRAASGDHIAGA